MTQLSDVSLRQILCTPAGPPLGYVPCCDAAIVICDAAATMNIKLDNQICLSFDYDLETVLCIYFD